MLKKAHELLDDVGTEKGNVEGYSVETMSAQELLLAGCLMIFGGHQPKQSIDDLFWECFQMNYEKLNQKLIEENAMEIDRCCSYGIVGWESSVIIVLGNLIHAEAIKLISEVKTEAGLEPIALKLYERYFV